MRIETGVRPSRGRQDALRDIELAALMAEAGGIDLTDMIRTLKIVLDAKAEVVRGEGANLGQQNYYAHCVLGLAARISFTASSTAIKTSLQVQPAAIAADVIELTKG
jgi:hypothetical protein